MDRLFQTMLLTDFFKPLTSINTYLLIGLLLTSACTQLPKVNESPIFPSMQAPYRSAVEFAQVFPKLSLEDQRTRVVMLNRINPQDTKTKLQLAIAYGLPSSRLRDHAKAQTLVDELMKDISVDSETLAFLSLLNDYLSEISKSNQKIKDEQKRADGTQQKLEDLQKKLDDLKNIEKTMVDRDQGVRK